MFDTLMAAVGILFPLMWKPIKQIIQMIMERPLRKMGICRNKFGYAVNKDQAKFLKVNSRFAKEGDLMLVYKE